MSPQEQYWFFVLAIDAGLALVFVSSLLWARARKPIDEALDLEVPGFNDVWFCNRCRAEVINHRCKCETSPSPWEPAPLKFGYRIVADFDTGELEEFTTDINVAFNRARQLQCAGYRNVKFHDCLLK